MSAALSLRVISRAEVAQHDDMSSAWIILSDLVYDITAFVQNDDHPGSTELLLEYVSFSTKQRKSIH